jgi:probable biosynthetic protein (TIGR04099 family)
MHWLRLAQRFGLDAPDFKDTAGRPAHAAFTALRLSDARLDQVSINAHLDIQTSLRMLSETEAVSTHVLMSENMVVGCLELISVFVARAHKSDNRSVARAHPMLHRALADGTDTLDGSNIGNAVITHPASAARVAATSAAASARASRIAVRALRPLRRPVSTIEHRSA